MKTPKLIDFWGPSVSNFMGMRQVFIFVLSPCSEVQRKRSCYEKNGELDAVGTPLTSILEAPI